jgi:hypothetical protein
MVPGAAWWLPSAAKGFPSALEPTNIERVDTHAFSLVKCVTH